MGKAANNPCAKGITGAVAAVDFLFLPVLLLSGLKNKKFKEAANSAQGLVKCFLLTSLALTKSQAMTHRCSPRGSDTLQYYLTSKEKALS